jgi:predicted 2-oxoglutarate/Fe(II)-dependent dioxygenase YbiX
MSANKAVGKQGLFIAEEFLQNAFCRELSREVRNSLQIQSPLPEYAAGIPVQTSTATRPKIVTEIENATREILRQKLNGIKPEIAGHFRMELKELRDIHFAIYEKGNFVARHVDFLETEKPEESEHFRKVTVVVFLNEETEEPAENCYGGGKLTVYGVFENEFFKDFGFPVGGTTGKLVAFPSKAFHEVTPVEHGTRLIISTGFS